MDLRPLRLQFAGRGFEQLDVKVAARHSESLVVRGEGNGVNRVSVAERRTVLPRRGIPALHLVLRSTGIEPLAVVREEQAANSVPEFQLLRQLARVRVPDGNGKVVASGGEALAV